jgi:hypothetical protein
MLQDEDYLYRSHCSGRKWCLCFRVTLKHVTAPCILHYCVFIVSSRKRVSKTNPKFVCELEAEMYFKWFYPRLRRFSHMDERNKRFQSNLLICKKKKKKNELRFFSLKLFERSRHIIVYNSTKNVALAEATNFPKGNWHNSLHSSKASSILIARASNVHASRRLFILK